MIKFDRFTLDNGLTVIVHSDPTSQTATVNLLYKVGARNERPERTGFAHLFEHLMFEGSKNVKDFDHQLQLAGGDNNAYTTNDYTNYYINLPKQNLETAFWLESDRMLELDLTQEKLDIQKGVVIEEFNQRYLNQPYGDWMLKLRPLAYKKHPYRWATIGMDTSHIANATLDEVKDFFYSFYAPNNAILSVAGNVETEQVKQLAEKWFGPIPMRTIRKCVIEPEPEQTAPRHLNIEGDVPCNSIYMAYHMADRRSPEFYTADLITDILAGGDSSRIPLNLIKRDKIFSQANAAITGSYDSGLVILQGKMNNGISFEQAQEALQNEADLLWKELVSNHELQKVKNCLEIKKAVSEIGNETKAEILAIGEMLGDANLINSIVERYQHVTPESLAAEAKKIFSANNRSTIFYKARN